MTIYTRTGDGGMTSLRKGERVSKGSLQIAVLGELDELNCQLGFAVSVIENLIRLFGGMNDKVKTEDLEAVCKQISEVQGELLELGANVAASQKQNTRQTASGRVEGMERKGGVTSENDVLEGNKWMGRAARMEEWIDGYEIRLPTLANFILPGGGVGGASLHVARAVLRRTERTMVRWVQINNTGGRQMVSEFGLGWLAYLNRLGDWLFMAGRYVSFVSGEQEKIWQGIKATQSE